MQEQLDVAVAQLHRANEDRNRALLNVRRVVKQRVDAQIVMKPIVRLLREGTFYDDHDQATEMLDSLKNLPWLMYVNPLWQGGQFGEVTGEDETQS